MKAKTRKAPTAIAILTEDHHKVTAMFEAFEKLKDGNALARKQALVRKICRELIIHTTVEEEVVYPAARRAIDDDDLMDEADIEHAGAKALIAQLARMKPTGDHYDAKVKVLSEYIKHHVKEERTDMFPKMRKAKMDLVTLGKEVAARKRELARRFKA